MTIPKFLLDGLPEARAAHDAVQALQAEYEAAAQEWKRVNATLNALGRWDNGKRVPAHGVTTAAYEEAKAASSAAEARRDAVAKRLSRAHLQAKAVIDAAENEMVRTTAAQHALATHEEAESLWAQLQRVLDERDEAYRYAGSPGRDWKTRQGARVNRIDGGVIDVQMIMTARMNFDTAAVQSVLDSAEADTIGRA
jgi:hypothetical protein